MLFSGHGDAGYTSVIGGPALPKCDVRLEALGALDEAQAHLGLARALLADSGWAPFLERIQGELRLLMAECATVPPESQGPPQFLTAEHLDQLEADLLRWDRMTGGFLGFITPGDTVPGAHLHLARTVIRRAERQAVALWQQGGLAHPLILGYLNRLSSWLYAMAILVERDGSVPSAGNAA